MAASSIQRDTGALAPRPTQWWAAPSLCALLGVAAMLVGVSRSRPKPKAAIAPAAADAGIPPAIASDAEALYLQGRRRFQSGDYPGARPLLARAVALAPQNALAHATFANNLRMLGYSPAEPEDASVRAASASWYRA